MKILLSCLLICSTVCAGIAQRSIAESEDMRFKAQVSKDTLALEKLLGDDLVYTHSNALTESKSDFIKSVRTGHITYQAIQPGGVRSIRQYGKTGISNGVVNVTGLIGGGQFQMQLRYTAVYVKQKGAWRLVSWQSTKIP